MQRKTSSDTKVLTDCFLEVLTKPKRKDAITASKHMTVRQAQGETQHKHEKVEINPENLTLTAECSLRSIYDPSCQSLVVETGIYPTHATEWSMFLAGACSKTLKALTKS